MSPLKTQHPDNQVIGVATFGVGGPYLLESTPMQKKVITGIYAIINPLGQTYIGQAINWLRRRKQHLNTESKQHPKLGESIKRFGVEAHEFKLLTECSADLLDDFEFSYKQDFIDENGWENALFCFIDDVKPFCKPVNQFDLNGNLIATFGSATEAAKVVGVSSSKIGAVSLKRKNRVSAGGFQWRFVGDDNPGDCTGKAKRAKQPVNQFDFDGILLNEFESAYEAARSVSTKPPGFVAPSIVRCCRNKQKHCEGFQWRYKGDAAPQKITPKWLKINKL